MIYYTLYCFTSGFVPTYPLAATATIGGLVGATPPPPKPLTQIKCNAVWCITPGSRGPACQSLGSCCHQFVQPSSWTILKIFSLYQIYALTCLLHITPLMMFIWLFWNKVRYYNLRGNDSLDVANEFYFVNEDNMILLVVIFLILLTCCLIYPLNYN